MALYGLPIAFALFVWWFSTGLIIFLDHLPRRAFPVSLLGASVLAGLAFHALTWINDDTSVRGAYAGFVVALIVWGWQEMSFLMGIITGPRKHACPHHCCGWKHLIHGVQVVIYHEVAMLAGFLAILTFSWGGVNQVATWTYTILWGMRISAKLNFFLGVSNVSERFLPVHLRYLGSFFRQRPMNVLMPLSVTSGMVLSGIIVQHAADPAASEFAATSATLLAAMMVLGVVEHWALVIFVPLEELWSWYPQKREARLVLADLAGVTKPVSEPAR